MSSRTSPVKFLIPAALAVAALALTGCSSDGKTKAEPEEGPLSKYMSALWSDGEMTQEQLDKDNLKIEDLVAECMTQEGFEYKPNTSNGGVVYAAGDDENAGPDWGTEEFAKEYGYGIIDSPGMSAMDSAPEEEYVDPNQDYINSLSESEQTAFYEVLYGPGPSEEEMAAMEEGDGSFTSDWTTQGCYGKAQHEIQKDTPGGMAPYEDPEFTELFDSMNEVWNAAYDEENPSPEIAQLNRDWADCMAEAGFPDLTSPTAAQSALADEYYGSMSGGETEEYTEPSKKEQDAFQKREIDMAVADWKCRDGLQYDEKQHDVSVIAEQKFVDENKAALDALIAKHGTKQKD
ncbi:hypothetical protein [Leucobacter luti]|uniref:hypothetical protein n=1 Tax=Leucobacter luti TaxID=340320 RepID=UPI001C68A100|nr:hypothetical protein [Leucobacter luti]QYM76713.1 hypothetical protein K1X41_04700 [Leucobacter luti]